MFRDIDKIIQSYDSVVIYTHVLPDMDALGSQCGLKLLLQAQYPEKNIYALGDINDVPVNFPIDQEAAIDLPSSLALVLDTSNVERVSNQSFVQCDKVVKIDHHVDHTPFGDVSYVDTSTISTCSMITSMARELDYPFSRDSANFLLFGLITDSGRFRFPNTRAIDFDHAAFLLNHGADLQFIYDNIYVKPLSKKAIDIYAHNTLKVDGSVAYIKTTPEEAKHLDADLSYIKSGAINVLQDIQGVNCWATFTQLTPADPIYVELRGRIPVLPIALAHGGGGHLLACGCTVHDWAEVDQIIEELHQIK
jgi:bifunctional oligoribonuclease and PAP phosphatase NrnA